MPRTAAARRDPADEAATTRVDELIRLGRGQGHLSLTELRAAFAEAGVSASEGRSIIRELAEAGVRLGNEPAGGGDAAQERARTGTEDMDTALLTESPDAAEEPGPDGLDAAEVAAEAEAVALAARQPGRGRQPARWPRSTSTTRRRPWATRCTPT